MERFAKFAAQALSSALQIPVQFEDLEIPPDPKLGDFAFPCFKLAKEFKKSPPQVAQEIADRLMERGLVPIGMTVAATGPYVNFITSAQDTKRALLADILAGSGNGSYGSLPAKTRGTWVIEYSSPNVAKPLNIYHVRSTALGAALDRVGQYRGYNVISINHLGDWGTQYGFLTVAFRIFNKSIESDLSMMELVDLYVKVNAEATKNPDLQKEAQAAFLKLEQGDPAVTALWKKCVEISIREFERVYKRLNVQFDHILGESFYRERAMPILEELRKRGLLVLSEGAWVVPVTDRAGKEIPPCILQKSDGATIYATRDLAAAIYRNDVHHFDRMTYVVGKEQKLHFEQVFGVLRQMNLPWEVKCEHVPLGLYRFKDAKMSTRKGNFVTLEDVLSMAKERVAQLMTARASAEAAAGRSVPGGGAQVSDDTTEAVAIGAVIFHDLHTDPIRDVEFDVERVVDFEGETGPYLQYAHTRCLSILRKARETGQLKGEVKFVGTSLDLLTSPEEMTLIKTLGQFPLHLERTLHFSKASQLAHYLIEVTKVFGAFYRECRVLGEAPQVTEGRLMLVEATRRILNQGLTLLGIPLPERM